jgi:hypothetical protein
MTRQSMAVAFKAGSARAGQFAASRPDWFLERFGRIPTTNFQFLLVGYLAIRTCEHYMREPGWTPNAEWLAFIVALAGSSVFQWIQKRKTDHTALRILQGQDVPPPESAPAATTEPSTEAPQP